MQASKQRRKQGRKEERKEARKERRKEYHQHHSHQHNLGIFILLQNHLPIDLSCFQVFLIAAMACMVQYEAHWVGYPAKVIFFYIVVCVTWILCLSFFIMLVCTCDKRMPDYDWNLCVSKPFSKPLKDPQIQRRKTNFLDQHGITLPLQATCPSTRYRLFV